VQAKPARPRLLHLLLLLHLLTALVLVLQLQATITSSHPRAKKRRGTTKPVALTDIDAGSKQCTRRPLPLLITWQLLQLH
jgi:hypothetical protein